MLPLVIFTFLLAAPFYSDKHDLLFYIDHHGERHAIGKRAQWENRRKDILANMQQVMGPLPGRTRMPVTMAVIEEAELPLFTRKKITFVSDDQDRVPAYLLIPKQRTGKRAAMLCLHQTTRTGKAEPAGLGPNPNLAYAAELAERGYITLAPDYPNFGDYQFDSYAHGYDSATMKG